MAIVSNYVAVSLVTPASPSPIAYSPATKIEVVMETRTEEGGLCDSSEGGESLTFREEQPSTTGSPSPSLATSPVKEAVGEVKSSGLATWRGPADCLTETNLLSARSKVSGARVESLEQVTKSLMDFFSKVPFLSLIYFSPLFFFLLFPF